MWPLISAIAKRVRGGGPRPAGRFVLPEPTFAGIADALRASRSEKDSLKLQKWAGGIITPLEAAELKEESHRFPPATQAWLGTLAALGEFAAVPPQRYRRQALVPDIDIYSDASIPSARKSLILGFSGSAGQLMIPTPVFLQYVPSERYDVVVLRDRTKQGYAIGIPPYAHNLWDLAQKLTAGIGAATYRRVYPYGTSMGGFPALRCGLLLRTETSVSGGGQFPWYPPHLARNIDIPAFDPLCDCNVKSKTKLICYYSTVLLPTSRASRCYSACCRSSECRSKPPGTPFSTSYGARDGCGRFTTESSAATPRKRRLGKAAGLTRSLRPRAACGLTICPTDRARPAAASAF